jgi:hypothetical protein
MQKCAPAGFTASGVSRIITLTKYTEFHHMKAAPQGDGAPGDVACVLSRKDGGTIQGYHGRGLFVPDGLTAREIMEGAAIIERECDVGPYTARDIASAVLKVALRG